MKNLRCFRNFLPVARFVYQEKGNEKPNQAVEKKTETPDYTDRMKREDIYRRAEAKGNELLKNEDPKKRERGQSLLDEVKLARETEKTYDVSSALMFAKGLDARLMRIASKEKPTAISEKDADKLKAELKQHDREMIASLAGNPVKPADKRAEELMAELEAHDKEMQKILKTPTPTPEPPKGEAKIAKKPDSAV